MIYLITGVPGSGKTLYAVSTLIQKLLAEKIVGKDGKPGKRRLVVDGVPDLIIPHEIMAPRPEVDLVGGGKAAALPEIEGQGLHNWWEWCRPGDVLVVDEVQRYWRPRGLGTRVPPDIAKLETHRHLGVDIVLITQNAMLLDQNVRRLVGRHLNVRRIFGGARALIYDWDGCQTDVHRTQGATRTVWSYPKSAYKLYKSSELHTKQRQKIPIWFAFPLVVLALGVFAAPKAYEALSGSMSGRGIVKAPAAAASVPGVARSLPAASTPAAEPQKPALVAKFEEEAEELQVAGCVKAGPVCRCYDKDAKPLDVEPERCRSETGESGPISLQNELAVTRLEARPPVTSQADVRFMEAVHGDKLRRVEWGRPGAPS